MQPRPDSAWPRPAWAVAAVAGVAAYVATAAGNLPRTEYSLAGGVEVLVVAAGVFLLVLVARTPTARTGGEVAITVGILGLSVVAYPSLFAVAVADVAGPVVTTAGMAWHTLPLTLVQAIPVMASARATGHSQRRWLVTIWSVAAASFALAGLSVAGVPGAMVPGTVLFLGSFLLAPTATWMAVRGARGQARRRAIVAALAALFPVTLIAWCQTLGIAAVVLGWSETWLVSALFVGFALGTAMCGLHALGAVGPEESPMLRTRTVAFTLNVLLAGITIVLGSLTALLATRLELSAGVAVLVGVAATALLGLPWLRLRTWTLRVVDPGAELRHELAAEGVVADGQHRLAAQRALRRVVDDPALLLAFPVGDGRTIDASDVVTHSATTVPPQLVLARRDDQLATILATVSTPEAARRLGKIEGADGLLERAVWEARAAYAAVRADKAAEEERRRVSQDLHDGLQGKLVGLALQLRLSTPAVEDPGVRLLLDETVDGIRDAVDEVRALAGGRLPQLLVDHGLTASLGVLLRPWGRAVDLDLPAERLPAGVEATAYFVISEAVTNALKHSEADRIAVRVEQGDEQVVVTVADDGCGGADPRTGSGLRGLSERVAAVGGVLVVRESQPTGTTVEAVLPCGS